MSGAGDESTKRAPEPEGFIEQLAERVERNVSEPPFQRDTGFLETLLPLMKTFNRYFDSEVRGLDRLPEKSPMLLVGNHSGGLLVPDTTALIASWYEERGLDDPLVGLAFDALFAVPGFETLMRKIGEIPASRENAECALAEGTSVLVYPGGAREAFRPWSERNRLDFGGHKGFVQLALRSGVPVVPVVAHGGHNTIVVLTRGDRLASRLGLERLRLSVAPIVWQLPWGVSLPLLPGIPLPAKITLQVCEPLDWSHHGVAAAEDAAVVQQCYDEITGLMRRTLAALVEERPYPILSRLAGLGLPVPSFKGKKPDSRST